MAVEGISSASVWREKFRSFRRRASRVLEQPSGLSAACALLGTYLLVFVAIGGHAHWSRLWVPALNPPFADLLNVTSGWECVRKGVAVLARNPCDPWGRPANYPQVWMWGSHLGLGPGDNTVLGVTLAVLFFISALALVRRSSLAVGTGFGLGLISPAVMLGVERGNVDLFVFVVVAASLLLFRARGALVRASAHALLWLAAVLKLFPAFGFVLLLRQERRWRRIGGGLVVGASLAYVLATLGDIRTMERVLPKSNFASYGAGIAIDALDDIVHGISLQQGMVRHHADGAVVLIAALAALAFAGWLARRRWRLSRDFDSPSEYWLGVDCFAVGAAIFVGSFLVMKNWDYRLTFLLLTIPQLVRWGQSQRSPVPAPRLTLVAVLGTLWLSYKATLSATRYPFDELFNWWLLVTFSSGLFILVGQAVFGPLHEATRMVVRRLRTPV